ncbi:MAG: PAS domain S-box protein [Flavobacteriales bacterium]|nr:PAS domain S-box protein [Flavobacteriales bacterium]
MNKKKSKDSLLIEEQGREIGLLNKKIAVLINVADELEEEKDDNYNKSKGYFKKLINEYEKTEARFHESEERFRTLYKNARIGMPINNLEGNFIEVNPWFLQMIGYTESELFKLHISDITHADDRGNSKKLMTKLLAGKIESFDINKRYISKNGSVLHCNTVVMPLRDTSGNIFLFAALVRDISQQIKNEQRIIQAIIETEEAERKRFSYDLHDGLGQKIAAANMYMNTLESIAKEQFDPEALEIFTTGKKLINEATKETRNISHNITPVGLEKDGLIETLRKIFENYMRINKGINFKLNAKNLKLHKGKELTLYRILQELVSNILKHSKAKNATFQFEEANDILRVMVCDDGVGFNVEEVRKKRTGLGLVSVEHRLYSINGKIDIQSGAGKGTKIEMVINKKTYLS